MEAKVDPGARLAIALDTDDIDEAMSWARAVKGKFGIAKVGLELFTAHGPEVIGPLLSLGFKIFLDLKLHDIPVTVEKASKVISKLGVAYTTIHAVGGVDMVRAALSGLHDGARSANTSVPQLLGVTVLTSVVKVTRDDLAERISILTEAGADGLVCAPTDLAYINSIIPGFVKVVPGIRRREDSLGDQARVASPDQALAAGA
ncbi:MAG: orotidine-5'-phosphate decarboxylase, partial [Actinomycetota bacterium]